MWATMSRHPSECINVNEIVSTAETSSQSFFYYFPKWMTHCSGCVGYDSSRIFSLGVLIPAVDFGSVALPAYCVLVGDATN